MAMVGLGVKVVTKARLDDDAMPLEDCLIDLVGFAH
jgi:hypothetical protein